MNGLSGRVSDGGAKGIARRVVEFAGRLLPVAIVLLTVWAVVIAITGGIDVRLWGLRVSSREPTRLFVALLILIAIYAIAFRQLAIGRAKALPRAIDRASQLIAIALVAMTLIVALRYGSFVAAGSDTYGYISESRLFLSGDLIVDQPLAREVSWPNADLTLAPLGYRPTEAGGAIVPTYAPGLALLMAAVTLALTPFGLGGCGAFVVVPLLGAAMVWLTYRLALRLMSRTESIAAAALMATSPAFVASLLVPMSDVPVATFFLAAVVFALGVWPAGGASQGGDRQGGRGAEWRALAAGGATGLAVLVRPNLVPLTIIFAAYIGIVTFRARGWRAGAIVVAWFAAGVLPGIATVAVLNAHWYGAPWKSGYGSLGDLFSWSYGPVNARRYTQWLLDTQTPFILAFAIPFLAWRRVPRDRRAPIVLAAAVAAAVWISYLWYLPFEAWDYLRFLITSLPLLIVLALLGSRMIAARLPAVLREVALVTLILGVLGAQMFFIRDQKLLYRWEAEAGNAAVGEFVDAHLPRNAVLLSMFHSGTVRHYADRLTLRYDWIDREWWPRVLTDLRARGYRPYVILSDWEEPEFRAHFGSAPDAPKPGVLVATQREPGIRIYDPLAEAHGRAPAALTIPTHPCSCRRAPLNLGYGRTDLARSRGPGAD
jgi:hypothetical protein